MKIIYLGPSKCGNNQRNVCILGCVIFGYICFSSISNCQVSFYYEKANFARLYLAFRRRESYKVYTKHASDNFLH